MVVPFGISIGDFIAVGKLAHDIVEAVGSSKGGAANYQSFVSTLRSLGSCINAIKDVLEKFVQDASHYELHEAALINGINHEVDVCRDLLNAFLDNTYKYSATLLPNNAAKRFKEAQTLLSQFQRRKPGMNRLEKAWREVSWAVFRKEDVQKLERDLQGHLRAFQMYGTFLPLLSASRVEKHIGENALLTRNIQATATETFKILKSIYNVLPPPTSGHMNCQPIFFQGNYGNVGAVFGNPTYQKEVTMINFIDPPS